MESNFEVLVYGYGNPGRQDDGLGNMLVEQLEAWVQEKKLSGITIDSNYQLNIEDAELIKDKDLVIFVDASVEEDVNDFLISKEDPSSNVDFTMHSCSPGFVLHVCQRMNSKVPEVFLVHIKGYEWALKEELTEKAKENMEKALEYIKKALLFPDLLKITKYLSNRLN